MVTVDEIIPKNVRPRAMLFTVKWRRQRFRILINFFDTQESALIKSSSENRQGKMQDPLELRLDRIQAFLTANGAGTFAQLLYNVPILYRTVMDERLTMIIAPSDQQLLSVQSGKSVAELSQSQAGRDLLSNHVSILPTQTVYPMFTAINGVTYGSTEADLLALQVTASTTIDGVKILITPHLIGYAEQLTKSQRRYEPGIFAGMSRDAFRLLINNGSLRGRDLISLCRTNDYVNDNFCNHRDASGRTIFHHLVKEEFNIDIASNLDARGTYMELHQELEFKSYPTVGVLIDHGPNWRNRQSLSRLAAQHSMQIFERWFYDTPVLNADGTPSKKIPTGDGIEAASLTFDRLINSMWNHPINLYLLASVYNPEAAGEDKYRMSLRRLIQDPQGQYVSDDGRERFSLNVDPLQHNPTISNAPIGSNEIPIVQRVIHYTQPYIETLPFLYNRKIMNYDREELFALLPDLYRNTLGKMTDTSISRLLSSTVIEATNILDFLRETILARVVETKIDQSLDSLAAIIATGNAAEEQVMISFRRRGGADLVVWMPKRFHLAYNTMSKSLLIILLQLIFLFSGAITRK